MACLKSKYEKQLSESEIKEAKKSFILTELPIRVLVGTALVGFTLGLMAISVQIGGMARKSPYYEVGTGIWTGIYMIFQEVLCLWLVRTRSTKVYQAYRIVKALSLLTTTPLALVNSISIRNFGDHPNIAINITLLVIGLTSKVVGIVATVALTVKEKGVYKKMALRKGERV